LLVDVETMLAGFFVSGDPGLCGVDGMWRVNQP